MSKALQTEPLKRRVFAIISHPDAGKTTLTENMLLASGAIHQAGRVAARGEARRTQSDWMKIEQERGISVSSSVMTFEHKGLTFNLLDTPGHEDFSEDTYRTLTAADCAVMVLDVAKGIEPQTLKLFEVCRLRDIPIVTFINKLDREGVDPFELIAEIENKLALDVVPMQWPAASGRRFKGVADLRTNRFLAFAKPDSGEDHAWTQMDGNSIGATFDDDALLEEFQMEAELAREYPDFSEQSFREGHMTPVYFGSALRKFGVLELIDALAELAPPPQPEPALKAGQSVEMSPTDREVSGFVFKVQANMDLNHRDRVAFYRMVSGEFKRGMKLKSADGRSLNVHNPVMFFAQDRELAEEAYAGDVIGIPNHGVLRVGDSLSESGKIKFAGIPNFAPEILRRARLEDPLKAKHLRKALESLAEEGVTQLFKPALGADMIVGAVGSLQIDVMRERIKTEYGLGVQFEVPPYQTARWVASDDPDKLKDFVDRNTATMAEDIDGDPVLLAKSAWDIGYAQEKNPELRFLTTKERR
ncbi:peptide chain release factor 3 [uncultured Algimonas sp.]|uniref:peptide chain release factor 3 n=1 Tax=uncultured Algimonas sp. TaxID=1547920 RepID=UPI00261BFDF3|nr:peptide chain release factor 3 [uncultured Algimonas sp.]